MPKTTQEEKFRWIKPILDGEISIKNMAKICPFCERFLKYWLNAYKEKGRIGLENKSRRPKSTFSRNLERDPRTAEESRAANSSS
ncbi:MAG: helix-turn-helix domain-containing protein [Candidatus Parcubacteria bacterium]|nr:helix-turn-helix domain-containing protein [Candidatus Parcubacteria bacterium]